MQAFDDASALKEKLTDLLDGAGLFLSTSCNEDVGSAVKDFVFLEEASACRKRETLQGLQNANSCKRLAQEHRLQRFRAAMSRKERDRIG